YLAGAHAVLGDHTQAEVGYREVLAARTRALGPNHPATRSTRDALGLLIEPVPSFNVVLLGTRVAGKSVLLASMFHRLAVESAVEGVRVRGHDHHDGTRRALSTGDRPGGLATGHPGRVADGPHVRGRGRPRSE